MQNQVVSQGGRQKARLAEMSLVAGDRLALAAAPVFGVMALLTALHGGTPDMLCGAGHDAFPLAGMATMYGLMSAFHLAPWLRLLGRGPR